MKHVIPAFLSIALLAPSLWGQSSVWKVTKGNSTLYLGGTCHVLRASDLPLPPEFQFAYAASQKVVFETDLARASSPEMQRIIAERGRLSDGQTLEQILDSPAWNVLSKFCQQRGLPITQLRGLRPWLVSVMLANLELQKLGLSEQGVDQIYYARAKADGKPIGELEPFERQIDYLTGMASDRPSEFIASSIEDLDQLPTELAELIDAWRAGNLADLQRIMNDEMRTKYPVLYRDLLVARNEAWIPVVEKMLATPETEFVLAGVGHMAGAEGLVARLRERGCRVEQISAPPTH